MVRERNGAELKRFNFQSLPVVEHHIYGEAEGNCCLCLSSGGNAYPSAQVQGSCRSFASSKQAYDNPESGRAVRIQRMMPREIPV